MTAVVDASVVLRWFVTQPGAHEAVVWLRRLAKDPDLLVGPDLLRFEVHGGLARLQPPRDSGWAARCFERFDRIGLRVIPTDLPLFRRALDISRDLKIAGYDAVYLAHAESLGVPWLTADQKVLRRMKGDRRVQSL
jgi:predicted nucleic acid-binding protein